MYNSSISNYLRNPKRYGFQFNDGVKKLIISQEVSKFLVFLFQTQKVEVYVMKPYNCTATAQLV